MTDYNFWLEAVGKWGLGIVLALILVFMFRRFLNRVMDSMSEERNNYKELINRQGNTIDNHISHVHEKLGEVNVSLGEQKECLNQGFQRVCEAIKSQTEILSKK